MLADGMMGQEAAIFLRWIADLLAVKWEKDYGSVMGSDGLDLHKIVFCNPSYYINVYPGVSH